MHTENKDNCSLHHRVFYGAVIGAVVGMIIGTMPGNDPVLGLMGLGAGAALVSLLAALCDDFWESLVSAWEFVRIAFWRW